MSIFHPTSIHSIFQANHLPPPKHDTSYIELTKEFVVNIFPPLTADTTLIKSQSTTNDHHCSFSSLSPHPSQLISQLSSFLLPIHRLNEEREASLSSFDQQRIHITISEIAPFLPHLSTTDITTEFNQPNAFRNDFFPIIATLVRKNFDSYLSKKKTTNSTDQALNPTILSCPVASLHSPHQIHNTRAILLENLCAGIYFSSQIFPQTDLVDSVSIFSSTSELPTLFSINFPYANETCRSSSSNRTKLVYTYLLQQHLYAKSSLNSDYNKKSPLIIDRTISKPHITPEQQHLNDFFYSPKVHNLSSLSIYYMSFISNCLHASISHQFQPLFHYLHSGSALPLKNPQVPQFLQKIKSQCSQTLKISPKGIVSHMGSSIFDILQHSSISIPDYSPGIETEEDIVNQQPRVTQNESTFKSTNLCNTVFATSLLDVIALNQTTADTSVHYSRTITPNILFCENGDVVNLFQLIFKHSSSLITLKFDLKSTLIPENQDDNEILLQNHIPHHVPHEIDFHTELESQQNWLQSYLYTPVLLQHQDYYTNTNELDLKSTTQGSMQSLLQFFTFGWSDPAFLPMLPQFLSHILTQYKSTCINSNTEAESSTIQSLEAFFSLASNVTQNQLLSSLKTKIEIIHNPTDSLIQYDLSNKRFKDVLKAQKIETSLPDAAFLTLSPHTTTISIPIHFPVPAQSSNLVKINTTPAFYFVFNLKVAHNGAFINSYHSINQHTANKKAIFSQNVSTPDIHPSLLPTPTEYISKLWLPTIPGPYRLQTISTYEISFSSSKYDLFATLWRQTHPETYTNANLTSSPFHFVPKIHYGRVVGNPYYINVATIPPSNTGAGTIESLLYNTPILTKPQLTLYKQPNSSTLSSLFKLIIPHVANKAPQQVQQLIDSPLEQKQMDKIAQLQSLHLPQYHFCSHFLLNAQQQYYQPLYNINSTQFTSFDGNITQPGAILTHTCSCFAHHQSQIQPSSTSTITTSSTHLISPFLQDIIRFTNKSVSQTSTDLSKLSSAMFSIEEDSIGGQIGPLFHKLVNNEDFSILSDLLPLLDQLGKMGGGGGAAENNSILSALFSSTLIYHHLNQLVLFLGVEFTSLLRYFRYLTVFSLTSIASKHRSKPAQNLPPHTSHFVESIFAPLTHPISNQLIPLQETDSTAHFETRSVEVQNDLHKIAQFLATIQFFSPSCMILPSSVYSIRQSEATETTNQQTTLSQTPPLLLSNYSLNPIMLSDFLLPYDQRQRSTGLKLIEMINSILPQRSSLPKSYSNYLQTRSTFIPRTDFAQLPQNHVNTLKNTDGSLFFGTVFSPLVQLPKKLPLWVRHSSTSSTTFSIVESRVSTKYQTHINHLLYPQTNGEYNFDNLQQAISLVEYLSKNEPTLYQNFQTGIKTILCSIYLGCGYVCSSGSMLLVYSEDNTTIPLTHSHLLPHTTTYPLSSIDLSRHMMNVYTRKQMYTHISTKINECLRSLNSYYKNYPCPIHSSRVTTESISPYPLFCTCLSLRINYDLDAVVDLLDTTHESSNWVRTSLKLVWAVMLSQQQSSLIASGKKAKPILSTFELYVGDYASTDRQIGSLYSSHHDNDHNHTSSIKTTCQFISTHLLPSSGPLPPNPSQSSNSQPTPLNNLISDHPISVGPKPQPKYPFERLLAVDIGHPCYPHIYIATRGALRADPSASSVTSSSKKVKNDTLFDVDNIYSQYRYIFDHSTPIPLTNAGFICSFAACAFVSQLYHSRPTISSSTSINSSITNTLSQPSVPPTSDLITTEPSRQPQQSQYNKQQGYFYYTLGGAGNSKAMSYKYAMCIPEHQSIGSIIRLSSNISSFYIPYNSNPSFSQHLKLKEHYLSTTPDQAPIPSTSVLPTSDNLSVYTDTVHVDTFLASLRQIPIPCVLPQHLFYYDDIVANRQ